MIQAERIKHLNSKPFAEGCYVLYWMQASQRAHYNYALEFAIQTANRLDLPLLVYFGLTNNYPEANLRHYQFMLEGLTETKADLAKRNIKMIIRINPPPEGAVELAKNAGAVITDCGYLSIQKKWRNQVAIKINCPLIQVESDVVVPVQQVTDKQEYAAKTIRPKIHRILDKYLIPVKKVKAKHSSLDMKIESVKIDNVDGFLETLDLDRSVAPSRDYKGGTKQALKRLREFINKKLDDYPQARNDPTKDGLSNLSPYLHFGQISPLYITLEILKTNSPAGEVFLEELIVRRELAINFVHFNPNYDKFIALPGWAKASLNSHRKDKREYIYTKNQLEQAQTHDPYWNAAQKQMVITGKMHGYMRMYWGKKIIEWTSTPQHAYKVALYLNNKYEIDGRDPNGYTGVAWCFGKHDRPWKTRDIFGSIRYMNDKGLQRKFNADAYVEKINRLCLTKPQAQLKNQLDNCSPKRI